ncbi:uncharacterized protein IAS62_003003 [Cryptococcus decagattii]|uniref:Uncharacterized protein n=1 Tax=Cryptococcus decagattii TaxID=1859122 RepID=A0ABZ2AW67_9TREE
MVRVIARKTSIGSINAMNEAVSKFLPDPKPARNCIQAGKLPREETYTNEIECMARIYSHTLSKTLDFLPLSAIAVRSTPTSVFAERINVCMTIYCSLPQT